jgi:hypothetical protein
MAIACLRFVTFLPERPERSCPRFISCMAPPTFLLARLLERLLDVFFAPVLRERLVFFERFEREEPPVFLEDFLEERVLRVFRVAMAGRPSNIRARWRERSVVERVSFAGSEWG